MKNLLVLGGLAAVFAAALVLVLVFNNSANNYPEASRSTQANLVAVSSDLPEWYCDKVKILWEEGDFTDRFGGIYDASSCKELYFSNPYTWDDTPPQSYNGLYTSWYCDYVKDRWDEGGWTERFGDAYDPGECKYYYYSPLSYSSQYGGYYESSDWEDSPEHYNGLYTWDFCYSIKSLWDQGGWTERFGSTTYPSTCKEMYFTYPYYNWEDSSGDNFDDYWFNYILPNDFTQNNCEQVKDLWYQGKWTATYGSIYAPAICSDQYTEDWYSDYSWECDSSGNCWDNMGYTWYDPAHDTQESLYWWDYVGEDDFTYGQCYEIKQIWDQGSWTAKYGNTSAPQACDSLYSEEWNSSWGNNSGNIPPAGYEDEVYTVYTENPFPDTDITTLEGTAAAYLYNIGVIGGFPDGEFKGDREVNRAEAAKFLLLAAYGVVADVSNGGQFSDVLDGQWYTKFVVTAANLGIISGYSDGTFKPGNSVNTAEFLKMLTLTFDLQLWLDHDYTDVPNDSWYAQYAGVANYYNLFPFSGNSLNPGTFLTREEVAVALYQFFAYSYVN